MKTTNKKLAERRTGLIEAIEERVTLAIEGGIYSGPCTTGAIRPLAPPTVTPQPPAPFRDVFAKYTIGPV